MNVKIFLQISPGITGKVIKRLKFVQAHKPINLISHYCSLFLIAGLGMIIAIIVGYLVSGDPGYISTHKNARSKISKIDRNTILEILLKTYIDKVK